MAATAENVTSIPTRKALTTASRSELEKYWQHCRSMSYEWIRRQVIQNDRIDILASAILGYEPQPFHLHLLRFQFLHPQNIQLCFRGAGKTTFCTITKTIHLLLKNPNLRILIASKSLQNAEGFLKEIKSHFESNELLAEIFGPYYDARKVNKWDNREIEVLPRTTKNKESSVTCVGVEGTIVSKHYDVIISDDLVDEDNSRTKTQRDKIRTWYYQTLDPTLEPPDPAVPHRGEHHHLGTRYHYDDLWGHLLANELKDHFNVVRALEKVQAPIAPGSEAKEETEASPWPEKYPVSWFQEKRRRSGIIIFNAQYQCDAEAMKGEIFKYDDCQQLDDKDFPNAKKLRIFMGVDLAISEDEAKNNDKFAIVVIGVAPGPAPIYYVLDWYENRIRFSEQTAKIIEFHERWDPVRIGIETNAYQAAQYHNLKDERPDIRAKKLNTVKDKITRAWKLSAIFEEKKVFFKKSQGLLIEHMVLFPSNDHDDLFDAFDHAVSVSKKKTNRRRREKEPGLF